MTRSGAYRYVGWEDECEPPEPDKRWLTILSPDGEEVAVVVQRKRGGVFRDDDALRKVKDAELIVNSLNTSLDLSW